MIFSRTEDISEIVNSIDIDHKLLSNKNIIISGAFGFIGKYILQSLIEFSDKNNIEFNIYAIDNFITSSKNSLDYFKSKKINCIDHDINKELNIDINFDYIICLAGIASPYYYFKYPLETLDVSINGVRNMFKLNHNDQSKFIFFSTSEVYGDPPFDQIPTKESYRGNVTSTGPRSCYDESKRVGETICYINSSFLGKNTTIIRPFNVYGPGMSLEDYRILPNITRSLFLNEQLKIYDTGKQTRTYCYITDAINGFLRAIFKNEKFGLYNIGNDVGEINVLDLVKMSEKIMETRINYKISSYPKEYPSEQPTRRCPDISNAKKNLSYFPKIALKEGLKRHFICAKSFINN